LAHLHLKLTLVGKLRKSLEGVVFTHMKDTLCKNARKILTIFERILVCLVRRWLFLSLYDLSQFMLTSSWPLF